MDYEFAYSFKKPQLTNNWILDMNPLSKLNLLIILFIIPITVQSWKWNVMIIIFYFLVALVAGCFKRFTRLYLRFGLMVGLLLFVLRALFIPGENLLYKLWFINITQEGVDSGLQFSTLVVAICGAIILYSIVTRAKDFMYMIEKLGASRVISYVILSSFQSIIDLGEMSKVILDSQRARGIETEGNIRQRIKAFIPILGPLFLGAISNAEEKAIAMDARAFSMPIKNTHLCHLRSLPVGEKAILIAANIAFIGFVVWRLMA
ncbi:energy-coupling factor transporter transmembrane component T [Shimazuella kribbensis]|uniref:energy-coupling factor transporter transmembrane component T n=1 Tax=Shimazuella kribbensis TaxID=139808 RepID=UPI00040ACDD4|nr:energy-coupling factor transporter transmembrane component T [Shimazuella kribbensis]